MTYRICPTCGGAADYIEKSSRWYCYNCEQYLEERAPYPPAFGMDGAELRYAPKGPIAPSRALGRPSMGTYRTPPPARFTRQMGGYRTSDGEWTVHVGRILLVLSILGLVLFLTLPWVSVYLDDEDRPDETPNSKTYHYDFRLNEMGGNETRDLDGPTAEVYEERIMMSLGGAVGGIILGALMLYSPQIVDLKNPRTTAVYLGTASMAMLVLAVMLLYSAFTFFGWTISMELTKTTYDDYGVTMFSFASLFAAIIGFLVAGFAFKGIRRVLETSERFERRRIEVIRRAKIASPGSPGRHGLPLWKPIPYTRLDTRVLRVMVLLCTIGIITVPLLPWLALEVDYPDDDGSDHYYYDDEKDVVYYFDEPGIHGQASSGDLSRSLKDVSDDIHFITSLLWVGLFLSMLSLFGIVLDRLGYQFKLEWIGIAIPIIAILILVMGFILVIHIGQLDDDMDADYHYDYMPGFKFEFGGNVIPFIIAGLLLPLSLMHMATLRRHRVPWYHPRR